ncbi:unnamed protein product [Choristocarpus tenellus]
MSRFRVASIDFSHLGPIGKMSTDIDVDLLPENDVDFGHDFFQQGHGDFPLDLMDNGSMRWTVERERGISFDFISIYGAELKEEDPVEMVVKQEIVVEEEPIAKEIAVKSKVVPSSKQDPLKSKPRSTRRAALHDHPPSEACAKTEPPKVAGKRHWPAPAVVHRAKTRSQAALEQPAEASSEVSLEIKTEDQGEVRCGLRGSTEGAATSANVTDHGLVCGGTRSLSSVEGGRRGAGGGAARKVGAYTVAERAALVAKFHAKRGRRIWRKKIKYDCRKKLADKRPRLKGRFVTQEELDSADHEDEEGLGEGRDFQGMMDFDPMESCSDVDEESYESDSSALPLGAVGNAVTWGGGIDLDPDVCKTKSQKEGIGGASVINSPETLVQADSSVDIDEEAPIVVGPGADEEDIKANDGCEEIFNVDDLLVDNFHALPMNSSAVAVS